MICDFRVINIPKTKMHAYIPEYVNFRRTIDRIHPEFSVENKIEILNYNLL